MISRRIFGKIGLGAIAAAPSIKQDAIKTFAASSTSPHPSGTGFMQAGIGQVGGAASSKVKQAMSKKAALTMARTFPGIQETLRQHYRDNMVAMNVPMDRDIRNKRSWSDSYKHMVQAERNMERYVEKRLNGADSFALQRDPFSALVHKLVWGGDGDGDDNI